MTIIRLPLCIDDNDNDDDLDMEIIKYKMYTKKFINNTFKEIKDTIGTYHSVKEIECRRKLSLFFKQKTADFELFDLFSTGVRHLKQVKLQNRNIREVENQNTVYEDLANHIAGVFENLKQVIPPSFDVKTALQSLVDYQYLLPSLSGNDTPVNEDAIDFSQINRLCKIYLARENILIYETIKIHNGIVYLSKHDLQIEIILCGDIHMPKWQLLDIKEFINEKPLSHNNSLEQMTESTSDDGLKNTKLRNEFIMTIKRAFTDFSFTNMAKILEIYKSHCLIYNIYDKIKNARKNCELFMDGGYKRFTVTLDQYRLKFDISKDGSKVMCEMKTFDKTMSFNNDIISNIEKIISDSLDENSFFKFETGFIYSEEKLTQKIEKVIRIRENNKFSESVRDLSADDLRTSIFAFTTRSMLNRFIENLVKEKYFYRQLFEGLDSKYLLIRDHKSYGEHNVVIKGKQSSVVICLVSLGKEKFSINLQCHFELTEGVTQVLELKMSYKEPQNSYSLCFSSGISQIDMIKGIKFIKTNIGLLSIINRFYPFKDQFELSKNIHISDIEIKPHGDVFCLDINEKPVTFPTVDHILNHFSLLNLFKKLRMISQPSHPTSNLYLFKGKTHHYKEILKPEHDEVQRSIFSFENLVSFYAQKELKFMEFHFKEFNVSITNSESLEIESTKKITFKNVNNDLFSFIRFIDLAAPFLNLKPTICTSRKLIYHFQTLKESVVIKFMTNGYTFATKTKTMDSNDLYFNLDAVVKELENLYYEDRYNRIAAICTEFYETSITADYIECKSKYLKFTIDPKITLKIVENVSLVDTTHLECHLNENLQISDDFEELKVFNDLSKINNLKQNNKNKNC